MLTRKLYPKTHTVEIRLEKFNLRSNIPIILILEKTGSKIHFRKNTFDNFCAYSVHKGIISYIS